MILPRVFASVAIAYGAFLLFVAWAAWWLPLFQWAQTETVVVVGFLIAAILFVPFVVTYSRMGLNTEEGIFVPRLSAQSKANRSRLAKACPIWNVLWYGVIGMIGIAWLSVSFLGLRMNAFHVFSGAIALLSGCWFAFVWPTASRLFPDPRNQNLRDPKNPPPQSHLG